jgi:uncharacterized protein (DUF2336 family)
VRRVTLLASVVDDIELAAAVGNADGQAAILKRLTGLFVEQAPRLGDAHIAVFDEVILRLARDIEFRARVELAEALADLERAPRGVVSNLALDENARVAGPVLERSPVLDVQDLLAVAQTRGQEHLLAMTRRPVLEPALADVLVERGDERVVRSVAVNDGAQFSDRGRTRLAHRAAQDPQLGHILEDRADYGESHMAALVEIARAHAQDRLRSEVGGLLAESVEAAVNAVTRALTQGPLTRSLTDSADALVRVLRKARGSDIDEALVASLLREGAVEDGLAALAYAGRIPIHLVARAYHAPSYDPLLFVVRSLNFKEGTFALLLACKTGREPHPELLKTALEHFRTLKVATAQQAIRSVMAQDGARH